MKSERGDEGMVVLALRLRMIVAALVVIGAEGLLVMAIVLIRGRWLW